MKTHFSNPTHGFTLLELLTVLAILAILASIAYPSYQNHTKKSRLNTALSAMMENASALEQHYASHGNFKKNSTTWANLPQTQTAHFCIKMQGNPRGTNNNHQYALKAVAFDKTAEPRVLILNQDQTTQICQSSTSTCDEGLFFSNPSRADKDCTAYY